MHIFLRVSIKRGSWLEESSSEQDNQKIGQREVDGGWLGEKNKKSGGGDSLGAHAHPRNHVSDRETTFLFINIENIFYIIKV